MVNSNVKNTQQSEAGKLRHALSEKDAAAKVEKFEKLVKESEFAEAKKDYRSMLEWINSELTKEMGRIENGRLCTVEEEDRRNDRINMWTNLKLKVIGAERHAELHAQRLGLDSGEVFTADDMKRILSAIIHVGNAMAVTQARALVDEILLQSRMGAVEEELVEIAQPFILGHKFVKPIERLALGGNSHCPTWLIKFLKDEYSNYIVDEGEDSGDSED